MAIINSEEQFIIPSDYNDEATIPNDFAISLNIVSKSGKRYLQRSYPQVHFDGQKKFFRDLVFSTHAIHPLISKFEGYWTFGETRGEPFSVLSEFPENGFLLDYLQSHRFSDTQKSKYLFGLAIIGSYLASHGISHRCFAPPCFGVSKDLDPILLMFCTSKQMSERLNATLQIGNICWLSPELDSDEDGVIDKADNYGIDIFSFGSILYYLFTGNIPFYDDNFFKVIQNKKNAVKLIPRGMPEEMRQLLTACWTPHIHDRINFDQILFILQSHSALFPNTDIDEFDEYAHRLLSIETIPIANTLASKQLIESVQKVFSSLTENPIEQTDRKILNSIYHIREEIDSYIPIIIRCKRAGRDEKVWIKAPPFLLVSALQQQIQDSFNIEPSSQILEIEETKQLADQLNATLEDLKIKSKSTISIYNRFFTTQLDSPYIKISIPTLGKVYYASYNQYDTVYILKADVFFATRIPIVNISLKFKGRKLNDNDGFEDVGIVNKSEINVEISGSFNTKIQVNFDFSGVIRSEKYKTKQLDLLPLTTIQEIMQKVQIDHHNVFAMYNNEIRASHLALFDCGIKTGGSTIQFFSIIAEDDN